MSSKTLSVGYDLAFSTSSGEAQIITHDYDNALTLGDLGNIAEWLAVAWENLSGEEYKPVYISERGYAADAGGVTVSEPFPPPPAIDDKVHIKVGGRNPFKGLRFPSQKGRDKA